MKIGIITDIHEDIIRLKEAFKILDKEKCDQIYCLGDPIGYTVPYFGYLQSRNAHEVIKMIKKKCEFTLVGNHDLYSIRKLPKHRAGLPYTKNWYSLDFWTRKKLSKNKLYLYEHHSLPPLLTKEDKQFIQKLPEYIVKKYDNLKILYTHYAYPDVTGQQKFDPKTPKDVKQHFMFMKKHGCTLGISGHDHFGGIRIFTENKVSEIPFNKPIKLTNNFTWLYGPCVAHGDNANGLLVFNTNTMEIYAVPLKSKIHILPKWSKL